MPVIGYFWKVFVGVCCVSSSVVDYRVLSVEKHPIPPSESPLAMVLYVLYKGQIYATEMKIRLKFKPDRTLLHW